MWNIIRELGSGGVTASSTTEYLDEADEPPHRIAVLDNGKIAAEGTAEQLKRSSPVDTASGLDPTAISPPPRSASGARSPGTTRRCRSGSIRSDGSDRRRAALDLDGPDAAGIEADELTVHTPDLDDVLLRHRRRQDHRRHQDPDEPRSTVR